MPSSEACQYGGCQGVPGRLLASVRGWGATPGSLGVVSWCSLSVAEDVRDGGTWRRTLYCVGGVRVLVGRAMAGVILVAHELTLSCQEAGGCGMIWRKMVYWRTGRGERGLRASL